MASTAITPTPVSGDTFAKVVLEEGLTVVKNVQGYDYALSKKAVNGNAVLYRTSSAQVWQWELVVTVTQNDVGGGALEINIPGPSQGYWMISDLRCYTDGNAAMSITVQRGANSRAILASVGAAAGIYANLPSIGQAATSSGNTVTSEDLKIFPGDNVEFGVGSIAQTKYLTIRACLILVGTDTAPTLNTTGSAGTPSALTETENSLTRVVTGGLEWA